MTAACNAFEEVEHPLFLHHSFVLAQAASTLHCPGGLTSSSTRCVVDGSNCYGPTQHRGSRSVQEHFHISLKFHLQFLYVLLLSKGEREHKALCSSSFLSLSLWWLSHSSPCAQQPPAVLPSLFPKVHPSQSVLPLFCSSFGPFHFLPTPCLQPFYLTDSQLAAFHVPHPCPASP